MRHLTFPRGEVFIEFGGTRCPPLYIFSLPPWAVRLDCIFESRVAPQSEHFKCDGGDCRQAAVAPAIKSPFAEKKVPCPLAHRPCPASSSLLLSALIAPAAAVQL